MIINYLYHIKFIIIYFFLFIPLRMLINIIFLCN